MRIYLLVVDRSQFNLGHLLFVPEIDAIMQQQTIGIAASKLKSWLPKKFQYKFSSHDGIVLPASQCVCHALQIMVAFSIAH